MYIYTVAFSRQNNREPFFPSRRALDGAIATVMSGEMEVNGKIQQKLTKPIGLGKALSIYFPGIDFHAGDPQFRLASELVRFFSAPSGEQFVSQVSSRRYTRVTYFGESNDFIVVNTFKASVYYQMCEFTTQEG